MIRPFLFLVLLAGALSAADDSKPALLSTTGGGTTWSDLGELQRDAAAHKPAAVAALAEMHLAGDQMAQNVPRAIEMFEEAAKAGQTSAAFRLGKLYDDGQWVPRDAVKSVEYYRQAALAGSIEAQYNLGALYASGRGLKRDYQEGLAWLLVAAKNGAEAAGAQQVRERLTATRRADVISAAEKRAVEIEALLKNSQSDANAAVGTSGPNRSP